MGNIRIALAVPTQAEYWGSDTTDEQGRTAAQRHLAHLTEWCAARYPGASITGRLVPETTSYGNRGGAWRDEELADDIANEIEYESNQSWPNAVQ